MFAPFSPNENGIRGPFRGYGIRENALAGVFETELDGETGDAATEPKSCSGTKAEISICRAAH